MEKRKKEREGLSWINKYGQVYRKVKGEKSTTVEKKRTSLKRKEMWKGKKTKCQKNIYVENKQNKENI